ncbi:2-hydroxyacyl-CoA dehydratase, partial [Schnuerera sp.]|uniref:2-hydroxyacyl-CoA dehydratase n=1 Tax=Schnuerera sp. TaxID=2794844 RepID=UPI002C41E9B7
WSHGQKIVGAAFSLIERKAVHGIIYISAFGCGLDSVLIDLVERKAKESKIPFTLLTIDEQTGEAGINTRIEAFIDMLEWRDKDEDNFSTYG